MGSLEDIRDNYKSLKQSSDFKLKLNGATYRDAYRKNKNSNGNLLMKKSSNDAHKENKIDEKYHINSNNVNYSLNKKGRWKMAKELVEKMSDFEDDDLDVRVEETCHRAKGRSSTMIAYNKSKGDKIKVKSAYANLSSILKSQEISELKELRKNEENEQANKNLIIIDLDAEKRDKKQINSSYDEYYFEYAPQTEILKHQTKKYKKNSAKIGTTARKGAYFMNEQNDDFDYFDDDYDYKDESYHSDLDLFTDKELKVNFSDLISSYTKPIIQKRYFDQKTFSFSCSDESNSHIVYLNRQNSKPFRVLRQKSQLNTKNSKITNTISHVISISNDSLQQKILKETFSSERYLEAVNTYPRIIAIDMTKDIQEKLRLECNKFDIHLWLVLRENVVDKSFNFLIKSNFKLSIQLDTIGESDNFRKIYENLIELIGKNVDKTKLPLKEKTLEKKVHSVDIRLSSISNKNETKDLNELKSELIDIKTQSNPNNKEDVYLTQDNFSCELCFDDNLTIEQVTILKSCSHAICNECFKNYVDSQVNNSFNTAGRLLCAVCDNELDLALIIAFASDVTKLELYLRLTIERILFVLKSYKWCLNPSCNKAVKLDFSTSSFGLVTCECGHVTCLKCNQAPHFPAKCSQISEYYETLKSKGLQHKLNDEIFHTKGKRCPKCTTFIEKEIGCNSMYCTICKEHFCWDCQKLWAEHLKISDGQHNCLPKYTKNQEFVRLEFKTKASKVKETNELHAKSIEHHNARLSLKNIRPLMTRLLKTIKQKDLIEDLSIVFEEKCKLQVEKFDSLKKEVNMIFEFLNELHFVCEHAYLLLDDENTRREKKVQLKNVFTGLELIIWKIKNILESGKGLDAIEELKNLHDKGLNCLKKINYLTYNE